MTCENPVGDKILSPPPGLQSGLVSFLSAIPGRSGRQGPTNRLCGLGWIASILIVAEEDAVRGTSFGRYRLLSLLGEGGMGEVWRAHDTVTDRVVAIKVLSAKLSKDEEFQRRFRREAHAAARLETPHVVPIYDYGEIEGRLFVCMRLIKGRDLAAVLADGPLEPARAVGIIGQVAEALHAAHGIGLIHRDIKPSNILLDDRDFAYLIDFGIARVADDTRMTKTGNTIGTFAYIAPERLDLKGEEDARVDIYSLACVLYECLTGQPPFDVDTMPRLIVAHMSSPPPRPSIARPDITTQVDEVIATGTAKDPNQRYATTIELADAARDAITIPTSRPTPSPPILPPAEQTPLPPTEQAHNLVTAQPTTVRAESAAPATPAPPPWQPAPPIPARAGAVSRRTKIALFAGVIAIVAVVAAAIGISALVKRGPSQSSPTSSSRPTSSARSYAAQVVLSFTGLSTPEGVAVDTSGTVYVADKQNNRVLGLAPGSSTQTVLPFTDLSEPNGVAVGAAGSVYVADLSNRRVLTLAGGTGPQTALAFTGLIWPMGVAVDAAGSVYVADPNNHRVLKLAGGAGIQSELPFTGLGAPGGVAVDGAGNVYVIDSNRVVKLAGGVGPQTELPFTGLSYGHGVAVDGAGNVYVTDSNRVVKLAGGAGPQTELAFTGLQGPDGVAVDAAGSVYVADYRNNRVLKLPVQ